MPIEGGSDAAETEPVRKMAKRDGVALAVLVQYIGYAWDNRYVLHVQKRFPSRFLAVCRVNPVDVRAPDHLSYWTEVHGFRGVRLSPDPARRDDWFGAPLMVPLFRRANLLNVPVLILTGPYRLLELVQLLEQVPETVIVLDHMADCINGSAEDIALLLSLAKYPSVYLKMCHILIEPSEHQPRNDIRLFLKQVVEAFGVSRIMWGSDWPFCLERRTYPQAIAYFRDKMDFLTEDDLEWFYQKTALRLWPFNV